MGAICAIRRTSGQAVARPTPRAYTRGCVPRVLLAAVLLALAAPATATAAQSSAARSAGAWQKLSGKPAATHNGARPQLAPRRFRALTLDRGELADVLAGAPRERTRAPRTDPLTISLPAPDGSLRRFAIQRSSVMAAGLADDHPEIATYSGTGIDDPAATVHLDLTPLGFHAAVRGPGGSWYIDPYYHRDQSLYVSYRREDLADGHGQFLESDVAPPPGRGAATAGRPRIDGPPVALRTYRLALASDPAYATYHGAANVTAAKVTLVNRVNQIYEDDLAIHLELVAGNDLLNFDTAAKMTGANGPCGAAACYTAEQASSCDIDTLDRTQIVIGQLIGASNYDIGHLGLGLNGGGIAFLGVVGGDFKGGGCTGVDEPIGDLFAVDYLAHEVGHQFGADHTFNGAIGDCGDNIGGASVEPGSGCTVMAYAGICDTDDLQPHSDPYFSQRSIDEITSYAGSSQTALDEIQTISLRDFSGADSFRLTYNGVASTLIMRGTNYTSAGIETALRTIPALASATIFVDRWDGTQENPTDVGFAVAFKGTLAKADVLPLTLTSPSGVTGFVGETTKGGPVDNGGAVTATGNRAPVVEAPAAFTIPARTPFSLTGSATDADNDPLTYLWEQNDAGTGTSLVSNTKPNGPLFRVFGTAAQVSATDALTSPSPGQNTAGTSPTRVFPDLAQIAAGNTNAASGTCPAAPGAPPVPAATVECYSEFLPTSAYTPSALHFRLTARDAHAAGGGVGHDDTTLTLAKSAGPFRVTSQSTATSIDAGTQIPVTWSVANTNVAPVSAANVRITMSTDGGLTFGRLVHPSTPNDGSQVVRLPNANTAQARIKVQAVGNVFFDVSHANFPLAPGAPEVSSPSSVTAQYSDAAPLTVAATDENSAGSALTATATGLPAGLSITAGTPSAGARTFTVGGAVSAAPGTYPVELVVSDEAGRGGVAFFDVVVAAESATATYTGDTLVRGAAGATQAPANLSFSVLDSPDATPGDVANATVTFIEGATTLCAARPVVTAGNPASGTATCTASLSTGAAHRVSAVIGGRYAGSGAGDVDVRRTPPTTPPPPPPPGPRTSALLAPSLAGVARRVRLSSSGRVSLALRCRTVGSGTAPSRCAGSLKLTARIRGKRTTIGRARFDFPRSSRKTVRVAIGARTRRALKRVTYASLTVTVSNAGAAARKATRSVIVLKPSRR